MWFFELAREFKVLSRDGIAIISLIAACALAWQDFRRLEVNASLACFTAITLGLGFYRAPDGSVTVCLLTMVALFIYAKWRPRSVQPIDIALFSLGVLWVGARHAPMYCFLTALFLVALKIVSKREKLPFLTAWFLGFSISLGAIKAIHAP